MVLQAIRSAANELLTQLRAVEALLSSGKAEAVCQAAVDSAVDRCLASVCEFGLWGEANRLPSSEIWNVAGPLLEQGWLQNRARSKPRGYAGDHELLGRMIRYELSDHPLGRLFDRYFQRLAAPEAVRNRTLLVADRITEFVERASASTVVTIVGCGPAIDIERALLAMSPDMRALVEVRLLDYDPAAIENAEARVGPLLPASRLQGAAGGLLRLTKKPALSQLLDDAGLILCTGMFDYLSDQAAVEMLKLFWQRLQAGGECLVFNFSPRNTSRAYMEWIGNWYLIYRDEAALRDLARAAGIAEDCVEFGGEPLGVDLFVRCRKPPA